MKQTNHCCEPMKLKVEFVCDDHPDPFDCADNIILFSKELNIYGIIVHDGGSSFITISFCPFCGKQLPKRND